MNSRWRLEQEQVIAHGKIDPPSYRLNKTIQSHIWSNHWYDSTPLTPLSVGTDSPPNTFRAGRSILIYREYTIIHVTSTDPIFATFSLHHCIDPNPSFVPILLLVIVAFVLLIVSDIAACLAHCLTYANLCWWCPVGNIHVSGTFQFWLSLSAYSVVRTATDPEITLSSQWTF